MISLDNAKIRQYIRGETKVSSCLLHGNLFTPMPHELVSLFLDAIRIDALSLKERPMAQFVREFLHGLPVNVIEDDIAPRFNGECGNIICIPRTCDPSRPTLALIAHLDTPRSTTDVKPIATDEKITSDGTTALGVDNRAGTAILLHALREHLLSGAPGQCIVVFTVGEELGLYGSRFLDPTPFHLTMGFVFDCSPRPGTFIQSAVGCSLFDATFVGKSAHAGVSPERGVNAIQVAAHALSKIPLGRLSPTMTCNVGMVDGGTATNVVPDRCTYHGEIREFDQQVLTTWLAGVERSFRAVACEYKATLEFSSSIDFPPFRLGTDDPVLRWTSETLRQVGLKPAPIEYLGGSDANMLNAKGMPTVNLGIGAQNPHGNDEFILVEDLLKSGEIARALIARSTSLT